LFVIKYQNPNPCNTHSNPVGTPNHILNKVQDSPQVLQDRGILGEDGEEPLTRQVMVDTLLQECIPLKPLACILLECTIQECILEVLLVLILLCTAHLVVPNNNR
jgi:hypothetical protein